MIDKDNKKKVEGCSTSSSTKNRKMSLWLIILGIPLLAAAGVFGEYASEKMSGYDNNVSAENSVKIIAEQVNKRLPRMVDSVTRAERVRAKGNRLIYEYTLVHADLDMLDLNSFQQSFSRDAKSVVINNVCRGDLSEYIKNKDVSITYVYSDAKGRELLRINIDKSNCR